MTITRKLEYISSETALDMLAASNRSPSNTNGIDFEQVRIAVIASVPDTPAFTTDIVIVNGYIVSGHAELSAIANSNKVVTAWVYRETTMQVPA